MAYLQDEGAARRRGPRSARCRARPGGPADARSAAGAARRRAVPTTPFPPTSRYATSASRRCDPGAGRPPIAYLRRRFVPPPERFAPLSRSTSSEGDRCDMHRRAPPRRPGAVLAARRRQRRARPARADRRPSAAGCASPCRRASRGPTMAELAVARSQLLIGPAVPVPAPREVIDALTRASRSSPDSGDAQSGFQLTFGDLEPLAAAHALPARRRLERSRSCASSIAVDRQRARRRADRRRDDPPGDRSPAAATAVDARRSRART